MRTTRWPRSGTRTPDAGGPKAAGYAVRAAWTINTSAGTPVAAATVADAGNGRNAERVSARHRAAGLNKHTAAGQEKGAKKPSSAIEATSDTVRASTGGPPRPACVPAVVAMTAMRVGWSPAAAVTLSSVPKTVTTATPTLGGGGLPASQSSYASTRTVHWRGGFRPPKHRVDRNPRPGAPPPPP